LSLLAAGFVLFLLLLASYSRRRTWLSFGSIALSMALLFGCLFLVTIHDRSQVRARLALLSDRLPLLLDRNTAEQLAASLERLPAPPPPPLAAELAPLPAPEQEAVQAATTSPGWFATKPELEPAPKGTSPSLIAWSLDGGAAGPVSSPLGFSIGGTNVSGQALEQVQAFLKPDSTQRELPLALGLEGAQPGDGTVIPADARFSLFAVAPDDIAAAKSGGAILIFRYVQAGQRKSTILYHTPAMLSRHASRD
jgi:hypothetical protein